MIGAKLAAKSVFGRAWRWRGHASRARRLVLIYHAVGPSPFAVSEDAFERQLTYLAARWNVVSLERLLSGSDQHLGVRACALTFDDGYRSVHEHAYPLLKRYGFPATLYVTTSAIGATIPADLLGQGFYPDEYMLTWPQVVELSSAGFSVGSHLHSHRDLTRLSSADVHEELRRSKAEVEAHIGAPCLDLAYPWGRSNATVLRAARTLGYARAVTGCHGTVHPVTDPLQIPRINIPREYGLEHVRAVLDGDWDFLAAVQWLRGLVRR